MKQAAAVAALVLVTGCTQPDLPPPPTCRAEGQACEVGQCCGALTCGGGVCADVQCMSAIEVRGDLVCLRLDEFRTNGGASLRGASIVFWGAGLSWNAMQRSSASGDSGWTCYQLPVNDPVASSYPSAIPGCNGAVLPLRFSIALPHDVSPGWNSELFWHLEEADGANCGTLGPSYHHGLDDACRESWSAALQWFSGEFRPWREVP